MSRMENRELRALGWVADDGSWGIGHLVTFSLEDAIALRRVLEESTDTERFDLVRSALGLEG